MSIKMLSLLGKIGGEKGGLMIRYNGAQLSVTFLTPMAPKHGRYTVFQPQARVICESPYRTALPSRSKMLHVPDLDQEPKPSSAQTGSRSAGVV